MVRTALTVARAATTEAQRHGVKPENHLFREREQATATPRLHDLTTLI